MLIINSIFSSYLCHIPSLQLSCVCVQYSEISTIFSVQTRFRVSTLIRYVCVFICIHFQQRFQIDAFSVNTLSVFERISVDGRPKRIEMYAFSNENALVWTGSKLKALPWYSMSILKQNNLL